MAASPRFLRATSSSKRREHARRFANGGAMKALYPPPPLAVALALFCVTGATAQTTSVIHVGLAPFEGQAGPYYAQDLGLFKAAGLDVDIQQFNSGAAIVAAIVGGSLQIGGGNPLPLAQARARGLKIVLI